jgi:hypothetical protein
MPQLEIKVRVGGRKSRSFITLRREDIDLLLIKSKKTRTIDDLAKRCGCSRENLSRHLNGKAYFPGIQRRLAVVLEEMFAELPDNYKKAINTNAA